MDIKNVFMFSGQGSQYYQMGKTLYEEENTFRQNMITLDKQVKKIIGRSIIDIVYDRNKRVSDEFTRTLFTHPAIFMVQYSLAVTLIEYGIKPDVVIGISLGEFTAAVIAGIIRSDKALELIVQQAECIEKNCKPGAIIAVIKKSAEYEAAKIVSENSCLVSINSDRHFIISGIAKNIGM